MKLTPADALAVAVHRIGSTHEVGRLLGVTGPGISAALLNKRAATAEWVLTLERASGVPKELLRPDLYPPTGDDQSHG
jgi:DNA-binding transcriptional regulator YdaS (Cro superfamily)